MATIEVNLPCESGRRTGSRAARRLRREDRIPAVLYGRTVDPTALTIDRRTLRAVLTTEAGLNALINVQFDGQEHLTVARNLQHDPVRQELLHVDLVAIDPEQQLDADVVVHLEGDAEAVHREGGIVDQQIFSLPVAAKPRQIPGSIMVDVAGLELGDTITVGDLDLPEGVTPRFEPDEPVVTTSVPRATIEAEAEEAAEEAAEAAEAEAEAEGGTEAEGGEAEGGAGSEE